MVSVVVILLWPRILVAMVAAGLIGAGVTLMALSWRWRRVYRHWERAENRWMRFIVRF